MDKESSSSSSFKDKVIRWAIDNMGLIFSVLRVIKPITIIKENGVITRYEDVQEVLSCDEAFNVTYAEKMEKITDGGNFFLGMPPNAQYQLDVSNSRIAIRRTDIDDIVSPLVQETAKNIVSSLEREIDFVDQLSTVVPAILVDKYLGIPGPSQSEMIDWSTKMFYYLFFPIVSEEDSQLALEAAAKTRNHIDAVIAQRKQSPTNTDDVLNRFLNMQKAGLPNTSDLHIRNNLIGIIIGAIPTTSKAATFVLEYLLKHPTILLKAQKVARNNDIVELNKYVNEALRFNPFGPGVFRDCIKDHRIARGTFRAKTIKKGTILLASTQSAMKDGRKIPRPGKFDINRPQSLYMNYGYGMHSCFGRYINDVQIASILQAVLVKENLRSKNKDGKPVFIGSFPSSFELTFN